MKLFGTLQKTEVKRAIRVLPQYFLGVLVLTLLIGIVALFGFLSTRNKASEKVTIALVLGNNQFLSTMGMQILDGAKSTEGICEFTTCETEELAMSRLSDGTYTAVILFPDSFVNAALYHDDAQATIYMPFIHGSFYAEVLKSLGDAAGNLLENTEACITTVKYYCLNQGVSNDLRYEMDTEINTLLGNYCMSREEIYLEDTASGTGNVSVIQYYFNAAIVMILLLGGISCGPLLKGDSKAYRDQLTHHRIGPFKQLYAKCLAVLTLFTILYGVIIGGLLLFRAVKPELFVELLGFETMNDIGYWVLCGLPILFLASAMVVLIYTFSANQIGGILLLFLVTLLMGYASGCIAPSAFLPVSVRKFAAWFPTSKMFGSLLSGMRHEADFASIGWTFVEAVICLALACGITYGKKVRES